MRNQSKVRNFIRMITYDNRLFSYMDGLHSMFVGEDKVVNVLKGHDAKQARKHLDFLSDFTNGIKNMRVYYERNEGSIRKDGAGGGFDVDEFLQELYSLSACAGLLGGIKPPPNPFGDCSRKENPTPAEDDEFMCCAAWELIHTFCAMVPVLKCLEAAQRKTIEKARKMLAANGCDCRISGPKPSDSLPGVPHGGVFCHFLCNSLKRLEQKSEELMKELENIERDCRESKESFEEGGENAHCLEYMDRNRKILDRISNRRKA